MTFRTPAQIGASTDIADEGGVVCVNGDLSVTVVTGLANGLIPVVGSDVVCVVTTRRLEGVAIFTTIANGTMGPLRSQVHTVSHAGTPIGPATVSVVALCAGGVVNRGAPLVLPAGACLRRGVATGHGGAGVGGAVVTGVGEDGDFINAVVKSPVNVVSCRDRR